MEIPTMIFDMLILGTSLSLLVVCWESSSTVREHLELLIAGVGAIATVVVAGMALSLSRSVSQAQFRPKARVRRVAKDPLGKWSFRLTNVGESEMTLWSAGAWHWKGPDKLSEMPAYAGIDPNISQVKREGQPNLVYLKNLKLPAGASVDVEVPPEDLDDSGLRNYVIGWVDYKDGRGVLRRTSFYRVEPDDHEVRNPMLDYED